MTRQIPPFFFFVCCFVVSILLLVSTMVVVVMGSSGVPTLLDKVCNKTSDYDFCTTTLLADSGSFTNDPTTLAKLALQLTSTHARVTKEYIRQLLKRAVVPGTRGNVLRCDFEYDGALALLQSALNDLAAGSYEELSLLTVLVHGNAKTCERGFTDGHQPSPLTYSQNNKLMNLSDICTVAFTFINA